MGKQWQYEFASQPSKYLKSKQSCRIVLPQPTATKGFTDSTLTFPVFFLSCLALLPSFSLTPTFAPFHLELEKTNDKSLFIPCLRLHGPLTSCFPQCFALEGMKSLESRWFSPRAILVLAVEVLREEVNFIAQARTFRGKSIFSRLSLSFPVAQALCLTNFDTLPTPFINGSWFYFLVTRPLPPLTPPFSPLLSPVVTRNRTPCQENSVRTWCPLQCSWKQLIFITG